MRLLSRVSHLSLLLSYYTCSYDETFNSMYSDMVSTWKPCDFFEHATCVAPFKNNATSDILSECLPSCDLTTIHQDGIHVSFHSIIFIIEY